MSSGEILLNAVFYLFALVAVVGAVAVAISKNIVRSAFALLAVLFSAAAFYAILRADFIFAAQIIIYVGGILVLIIFAVMLTHKITDVKLSNDSMPGPAAFFACACVLFALLVVTLTYRWTRGAESQVVSLKPHALTNNEETKLTLSMRQAGGYDDASRPHAPRAWDRATGLHPGRMMLEGRGWLVVEGQNLSSTVTGARLRLYRLQKAAPAKGAVEQEIRAQIPKLASQDEAERQEAGDALRRHRGAAIGVLQRALVGKPAAAEAISKALHGLMWEPVLLPAKDGRVEERYITLDAHEGRRVGALELTGLEPGEYRWSATLAGEELAMSFDDVNWDADAVAFTVESGLTRPIGLALMGPYLLPFEVVSVLLLAALIGAAFLARKEVKQ